MLAAPNTGKFIGLYSIPDKWNMNWTALLLSWQEQCGLHTTSLAEMTSKAIDILSLNSKRLFPDVEGGASTCTACNNASA